MTDYSPILAAEQRAELTKVYNLVQEAESVFRNGVNCDYKDEIVDMFKSLFDAIAEADDELKRDSREED